MLSSVSESVREMGQRQCIHFGRIAETTSRLNDLIVIQTEFRQSFLSAHPLIFDEVELKWVLNQFRIQFSKCVKNREHRYQFPMPFTELIGNSGRSVGFLQLQPLLAVEKWGKPGDSKN